MSQADMVQKRIEELTDSTPALCAAVALAAERDALAARVARLEQICAAAYQLAGIVGAPVRFLDALALHDDVDVDSLLPVRLEECDEFQRLRSQLNKAEVERAWALRGRTFVTPEPQS